MGAKEPEAISANGDGETLFDKAPWVFAVLCFAAGFAALLAAVTPDTAHVAHLNAFQRFLAETPEFSQSVAGVALMGLAYGLSRRLDAAMIAAIALVTALALYAAFRTNDLPAAAALAALGVMLFACRDAFYRRAALSALTPSPRWTVSIAAALAAATVSAVLWAGSRPGFAETPWWGLLTDPHLGRAGRALSFGVVVGAMIAAFLLLARPAPFRAPQALAGELAQVRALMAKAEAPVPDQALALLGDKAFLFSPDQQAVLMYAVQGGSLIAMAGPVGQRRSWRGALSAFRAHADRLGLRPVVYAAAPALLPDLLDLGFRMEKIGETALVDLAKFSLSGKARQNLRTTRRRFVEREHAQFEVHAPPHAGTLIAELASVSDAWLSEQKGGEKGFSLGRFDPAYLADHPLAIVRVGGRAVAFANLLETPDKSAVAVDLMRYHPTAAPPGVMDFLFTELILWAQAEGFRRFDLGMAPLAGLAEERYAPLFAQMGRLIFERAGRFYGFEGLRAYKAKFDPDWEPRYLAAPGGGWTMPLVLAEVALLTAGGGAKRAEAPAPSPALDSPAA